MPQFPDISRWPPRRTRVALTLAALLVLTGVVLFQSGIFEGNRGLKVGYDRFVPYVMEDGTGNPAGLAVEMVKRAANKTKIPIEWVRIANIDEAIRTRKIDIYPLTILTEQRQREFHASQG